MLGGGAVSQWLRDETEHQLRLLSKIRERLDRVMERQDQVLNKYDAAAVPDRDWMRAYHGYLQGFTALLVEERERAKLALAARGAGGRAPAELSGAVAALGEGDPDALEQQLRTEFARAAASFTRDDLELLARNLRPDAWDVLDRVRAEMTKES